MPAVPSAPLATSPDRAPSAGAPRRSRRAVVCVVATVALITGPAGFSSTVSAEAPTTTVTGLSLGERGPAVEQVQRALVAAGVPLEGGVDGYFGQMTATALRQFQSTQGLDVTGVVDEATAERLGLLAAPTQVPQAAAPAAAWATDFVGLTVGTVGPRVRAMQEALIAAGIPNVGGADGVFGAMTERALLEFQARAGLPTSSVVDAETATALRGTAPAAVPAASPTTPTTGQSTLIGLQIGSRGPAVAAVQEALIAAGLRFAGGVDGIFGMATSNALGKFQHRKGLEPTGVVDAATAAALGAPDALPAASAASPGASGATRPLAGLAPGNVGNNVRALQQRLIDLGVTVAGGADGIFGPATANALKQFQSSRGLSATGRVDQATADALNAGAAPSPSPAASPSGGTSPSTAAPGGFASFGERGDRVRALQQALLDAGIEVPGGADGIFGAQTAGAVMTFQRREGLTVTGVVDAATAAALGLTADAPPPPPSTDGIVLEHFPVQGTCHFADTWHAPRGGGRLHEGVDVIAPEGRYIYAVTAGTITHVYQDRPGSLTGNGVRLTLADGTYFFYAHLQSVADGIQVGSKVAAGQIIGTNGTTGNAGIPHLHFEVHPRGGAAVNPYPLVKAIDGCAVTDPPPQP